MWDDEQIVQLRACTLQPCPCRLPLKEQKILQRMAGGKQPCGCLHILMDMMTALANDRSFILSPAEKYQ